jgi:hypothetical protein
MLLDLMEVLKSHTGFNLARAFADVLKTFGIKKKVDTFTKNKEIWNSHVDQILSVTANNASNNDTMISKLGEMLEEFPGAANQTRCFAHTIGISAKAVIKQFDIPKNKEGEALDKAAQALNNLAEELDFEECMEQETWETKDGKEDDQMLDPWVDFHEGLMEEQVIALDRSVQPVRSMLIKVSGSWVS